MKAVIYTRVSDARQSDGTSLESQEQACRDWCSRNRVEIAKIYVEPGASARSANRPEFQKMFAWLEQNHASISHVVCDKWDRFSRSMDDSVMYRMQLKAWRIELVRRHSPLQMILPEGLCRTSCSHSDSSITSKGQSGPSAE